MSVPPPQSSLHRSEVGNLYFFPTNLLFNLLIVIFFSVNSLFIFGRVKSNAALAFSKQKISWRRVFYKHIRFTTFSIHFWWFKLTKTSNTSSILLYVISRILNKWVFANHRCNYLLWALDWIKSQAHNE